MDEENTDQLDQSNSTAEVATSDDSVAEQTNESGTTDQPAATSDWRVQKYGADWENSGAYWKDTSSHWRTEYDKEKKRRQATSRGIEADDAPAPRKPAANGQVEDDTLAKFQGETTEEFEKYLQQRMMKTFETTLESRERDSVFKQSLAQAREQELGDPENGIPSFAEVEESHLQPLIQQTVAQRDILIPKGSSIVRELLRHLPNPGPSAYTLGVMLRAKNGEGLRKMFAGQGREEFAKKINDVSRGAATMKNGSAGKTTGKLTPEDIKAMPNDEFEKLVAKNTGRSA